jgi:hypothetical protein
VTGDIWNLVSFCPTCDLQLVYSEGYLGGYRAAGTTTKLLCENCKTQVMEADGNYKQLEAKVQREIERRIRTGEYRESLTS